MRYLTDPGPWLQYRKKPGNEKLSLHEATEKYKHERMFYNLQNQQAAHAAATGKSGRYVLTNATIQAASALWFTNQALAEERYGLIGNWDVSRVTEFEDVFSVPDNGVPNTFNEDISGWNMSNATDLQEMFQGQTLFNRDLSNWDVSNVTNFNDTFKECAAYNNGGVNLNGWDVSSATNMSGMFDQASVFNQAIGDWDTRNVTTFSKMFKDAAAFNQDISSWNVENVTSMTSMFQAATSFVQDISAWNPFSLTVASSFMTLADTAANTADYDALLIAWGAHAAAGDIPASIGSVNFGDVKFTKATSDAATGRGQLVDRGFTPVDGGPTA
jgi:surface protein